MLPQCLIDIEAGMATHYVARELIALGHDVMKQVPPVYARPFHRGHKNDFRDAHLQARLYHRSAEARESSNQTALSQEACLAGT
jgi:transposase